MSKRIRKKECGRYLWVLVTHDEFEFPIYIADTCKELAKMIGVSKDTVNSTIKRAQDCGCWCKYKRIPVYDEELDDVFGEGK